MKSNANAGLWLLGGLSAILVVAGLIWFLQNLEQRVLEIDTGYSAAARRNPFLAAERFLERLEIPVQSISGRDLLRDLPPSQDTLVVNALGALNAERRLALHRWIEGGGRLFVEAMALWEEPDLPGSRRDDFLDRYGVRLMRRQEPESGQAVEEEVVGEVSFEDYPLPLKVGFSPAFYLEDASAEASAGIVAGERFRLLQYQIGDGMLTVTSDNRFLTNPHIAEHDHALFLTLLASPPDDGKIWLLYDSAMPWLGELLWHHAPLALASFLSLVFLFLWNLGARQGPLRPHPAGDRRDLLAHLQASADFLWRHEQGGQLTKVTRERVEQAWLRRHPSLRKLDRAERAGWIAGRAGLVPAAVHRTLYPSTVDASDLVPDAALLQSLWRSLSSARGTADAAPTSALVHNSGHAG